MRKSIIFICKTNTKFVNMYFIDFFHLQLRCFVFFGKVTHFRGVKYVIMYGHYMK